MGGLSRSWRGELVATVAEVCFSSGAAVKRTDSPRSVDPDDADVAEENALFVLLVLTGAASVSPVGRVGELHQEALLHRGARHGDRGWKGRGGLISDHTAVMILLF